MVILSSISDALRRYWAYSRARAELRSLDERMLKDIGVTRGEIDQLARKAALEAVKAPSQTRPAQGFSGSELHPAGQH